jgi:hypothetical protein
MLSSNATNGVVSSAGIHTTPQKHPSKMAKFLTFLKTLCLDMPLALIFLLLVTVYCLEEIHDSILVPFLQAAERSDDDLDEEFTYYDRSCSAYDLTTFDASDLVLQNTTSPKEAVDTYMTHGGVLFPQILPPDTVQKLREHVVERNSHLSELEEIELSQGTNRKSFALDASEADIVSLAIHQVASHPLLKETLQELVGDDDPAVSEITAITSYYGCPDQTWHQDVKADGSPLKFARTYTHSHSLFIALQDTSSEMGATSFCPGSHYCANDGMAHVCEEFGFQLSETPQGVWSSGDAALLSQHVWHRGARHSDPDAPERILFVMTFLARPDLTRDRRQLSRGTYFHMRWNMWVSPNEKELQCLYYIVFYMEMGESYQEWIHYPALSERRLYVVSNRILLARILTLHYNHYHRYRDTRFKTWWMPRIAWRNRFPCFVVWEYGNRPIAIGDTIS